MSKEKEDLKLELKNEWFDLATIEELQLKSLLISRRGLLKKSEKENWKKRPRNARGGGFEYHISSLPIEARLELINKQGIAPVDNLEKQEQNKE